MTEHQSPMEPTVEEVKGIEYADDGQDGVALLSTPTAVKEINGQMMRVAQMFQVAGKCIGRRNWFDLQDSLEEIASALNTVEEIMDNMKDLPYVEKRPLKRYEQLVNEYK